MNISEALNSAVVILTKSGVAQPIREARSLLSFALGKEEAFLFGHPEYELSFRERGFFEEIVERRSRREPFQHITGRQEFFSLTFSVSKDVLIPRPETELIVENALEILRDFEDPRICEIGTGSGCISIAILKNNETASAVAVDISSEAISVAGINALDHGVSSRIEFNLSDVFASLEDELEAFDLIVSNPPYIAASEFSSLQPEVRDFDPRGALTDDADGLSIIRRIACEAPRFLRSGGYLLMEIGSGQAAKVSEMFSGEMWSEFSIKRDLQGIPRMAAAKKS